MRRFFRAPQTVGNPISTTGTLAGTLGKVNPFRYRGYYYDVETGYYYLKARYYNPSIGRFISADPVLDTNSAVGLNLYAYCGNDPVNFSDLSGLLRNVVTTEDGAGSRRIYLYNRDVAVEYAREWYDGFNDNYRTYTGGDCANFVSQCLHEGGIPMTDKWHSKSSEKTWFYNPFAWFFSKFRYNWDNSDSWRLVTNQHDYLSSLLYNSVMRINSVEEIKHAANNFGIQPGDVLHFMENNSFYHAAIVTKVENGMIYYAGHSFSRLDYPLSQGMKKKDVVYVIKIGC